MAELLMVLAIGLAITVAAWVLFVLYAMPAIDRLIERLRRR